MSAVQIPQSTARVVMLKLFTTGTTTAATGKTLAITVSKNGGAFGNPNAGATNATEVSNGWYKVTLDTTDTGTVGDLVVRGTATACDDSERVFGVVKATNGGLTGIPDVAEAAIGTQTNGALLRWGDVMPVAPAANTIDESLFIADNLVGRIGTAQAGAASTITLDAGASATDGRYIGYDVYLYGGTGGGVRGTGQKRTIVGYVGATKVATVAQAWGTNPDNTSKFMLFDQPWANVGSWNGTKVATPTTAGIPDVNVLSITAGQIVIRKNTALANFEFFLRDSADGFSGKTGVTVTAQRSIDGGALAACANAVSEIGSGLYKISLAAADLNGNVITLLFTGTGAVPTPITVVTQP